MPAAQSALESDGKADARRECLTNQFLQTINGLLTAEGTMHKSGAIVDSMLIAEPSSTMNSHGLRC